MKDEIKPGMIAAVRVRGRVKVRREIEETLLRLNLKRVNNCTIVPSNDSYAGMLHKCESYIAYGEIEDKVLNMLLSKRARRTAEPLKEGTNRQEELNGVVPFRLKPPRHGYRSIKRHYKQGGSVGYMGGAINRLLERMI